MNEKVRPFLKWPGGKYKLLDKILPKLPKSPKWVEPFVGAGAVFLNVNTEHAILNDINPDLINLYQLIKTEGKTFIDYAEQFFIKKNNQEKSYYKLRSEFNDSRDTVLRSALFLYLNRHGYNGLCRYNKAGGFNVPFGQLLFFHQKSQHAIFTCQDYRQTLQGLAPDSVVYCDPPYAPISTSASFTQYSGKIFTWQDQQDLAQLAKQLSQQGIRVLISNHDLKSLRDIYRGAKISSFDVARTINCNTSKRGPVKELLALFA
jgi:DNA adenine methylase